MKKLIFSTIICSLMTFVACQNEDIHIESNNAQKVVVTANIEGSDATRVDLTSGTDSNGKPCVKVDWKASGESFWVRADGNDTNFYEFTQISGNRFEGTLPSDVYSIYYAYYPQNYNISVQDGTLNDEYIVMTGYCNKGTEPVAFNFYHETLILKPTFIIDGEKANSAIKDIVVDNVVDPNGANQQTTINVTPSNLDELYIFISIPYSENNCYDAGHTFTFTVTTNDNEVYEAELTTPIKLNRGKLYTATIALGQKSCVLPEGYKFRNAINELISGSVHNIDFVVNSQTTSSYMINGTVGAKAYLVVNGQTLEIHTSAEKFYLNANCEEMFAAYNNNDGSNNNLIHLFSIDFADCDTSKVTNMSEMFLECLDLMRLYNLNLFDTSNVTDMSYMFWKMGYNYRDYSDMAVWTLDLSSFNTANVTNMSRMFYGCTASEITINPDKFSTANVTNMAHMFNEANRLRSFDFSKFDTSKVTDMSYMLDSLVSFTSLDVSNFNTENVTNMSSMFGNLTGLTVLNLSNFNTKKVTNMSNMFNGCTNLQKLYLNNFEFASAIAAHDGTKAKGVYHIFYNLGTNFLDDNGKSTIIYLETEFLYPNSDVREASNTGVDTNTNIEFRDFRFAGEVDNNEFVD